MTQEVKIKKLHPSAFEPTYATDGSACFDLYSPYSELIEPNTKAVLSTELAFEIPQDHAMLVFSRSGHGFNHGVRLSNCVGVIDSDYRGELKVALHNDSNRGFSVWHGDRIAQAMIIPVQKVNFTVVEDLSETTRGAGGFGSTGK